MKNNNETKIDFSDEIRAAKEGKTLNKPFRTPGGPKKFSVYVKNEKGNVVKVNFGDPNMEIKRDDPNRRKSFRARHNCDNPGPKTKARYWSCRQWRGGKKVEGSEATEWDGETFVEEKDLLNIWPALAEAEILAEECEECESEAAHMKPNKNESHDQYMTRCQKAGHSKEECMKSHEGHSFEDRGGNPVGLQQSEVEVPSDAAEEDEPMKEKYASLWENIRKKKKRMGKNYRPAKPGDKDYPDEKSLKKAQKPKKKK